MLNKKTRRWLVVKFVEFLIVGTAMIGTMYVAGLIAETVAHLLGA